MKNYLLSLVVPIYGVERYIGQFAASVFSQWFEGVEFVFVNDGTKDRSMEVLEEVIESKFSHLRPHITIVHQQNMGLPQARRTGFLAARGEYILCADSDDWLSEGALGKVVAEIERSGADLVYFDLVKEYGDHQSVKREREYTAATRREFIRNIFNYRSAGYTVTKCFRRSLYTDNAIYTPRLSMHEDICLMAQIIFYAKSIVHLPEVLYHYRKDNPNALCSQSRTTRHLASSRNLLGLYANYKDHLEGSPIEDVAGGIALRAGWHAIIHKCDLWSEFPWLREAVLGARTRCGYRTPLLFQWATKIYARFFL